MKSNSLELAIIALGMVLILAGTIFLEDVWQAFSVIGGILVVGFHEDVAKSVRPTPE